MDSFRPRRPMRFPSSQRPEGVDPAKPVPMPVLPDSLYSWSPSPSLPSSSPPMSPSWSPVTSPRSVLSPLPRWRLSPPSRGPLWARRTMSPRIPVATCRSPLRLARSRRRQEDRENAVAAEFTRRLFTTTHRDESEETDPDPDPDQERDWEEEEDEDIVGLNRSPSPSPFRSPSPVILRRTSLTTAFPRATTRPARRVTVRLASFSRDRVAEARGSLARSL